MRPVLMILSFYFLACGSPKSGDMPPVEKQTTDTLQSQVKYDSLKNGLFVNATGDIGLKTFEKFGDDTLRETYITRVYTGKEEEDGGPQHLRKAVDTATFQSLFDGYYKDKTNVYFLYSTSDGGALRVIANADPKTFQSLGKNELARDKAAFYKHGEKISKQEFQNYADDTLAKEPNGLQH
ncbi:MAG: hypothetical protein EOO10_23705 [Chitinophagaceae bacterium]|nr:MAG: hypothetical protein EOO10_23705 [Chitinophagaceae bacterium]